MIRGAVAIVKPGSVLGPAMAGLPVRFIGQAGDSCRVEAHATRYLVPRCDLEPGRLWVRRGREAWQGPFPSWRDARAALDAPPGVVERLAAGRASPDGATCLAGGWRYRLAWGGASPPSRYG